MKIGSRDVNGRGYAKASGQQPEKVPQIAFVNDIQKKTERAKHNDPTRKNISSGIVRPVHPASACWECSRQRSNCGRHSQRRDHIKCRIIACRHRPFGRGWRFLCPFVVLNGEDHVKTNSQYDEEEDGREFYADLCSARSFCREGFTKDESRGQM